jgi:hypothetical protein
MPIKQPIFRCPRTALLLPVPAINRAQLLIWLMTRRGKTEADVDLAIASIEDEQQRAVAQIEWKYRPSFHHDNPLVIALALLMEIVVAELPDAFREAAEL